MDTIKVTRKIASPTLRIAELEKFIGKSVEITVTLTNTEKQAISNKSAAGVLSNFKDKGKIANEKQAWNIAVKNKHGNN
jgi:hypothetical protein